MQWHALSAATGAILTVSILYMDTVGTRVIWTADMLVSEFTGTHFGECNVIPVLWDVT
jgi:hypothetical protein